MKQLRNKKGMTLIEVMVVLLMMSILLVVIGSLVLNSFNYFDKTTDQDISKRSLDSISDFVRDELLYASDVRVAEAKPSEEDWHVFYVKEGKLYHDDEMLFSNAFYNHKQLEVKVRGYDSYRLDINYAFSETEEGKVYKTSDTLELLNLKVVAQKDKEFNPFDNISSKVTITDINKIYYKKGIKPVIPDDPKPDNPIEGTVADQMNCLTLHNNRYEFNDSRYAEEPKYVFDEIYRVGEMAYYEGYWWMKVLDTGIWEFPAPGSSRHVWKKIDANFDTTSAYLKDDIIIYKGEYYICIQEVINKTFTPEPNSDAAKMYFKKYEGELPKTSGTCPFKAANSPNQKYVFEEKDDDSIIYKLQQFIDHGISLNDVPLYDPAKLPPYQPVKDIKHITDFVKIFDETLGVYRYYIMLFEVSNPPAPGSVSNQGEKGLVWQEIKTEWDPFSAYADDDMIYFPKVGNSNGYYSTEQDIKRYDVVPGEGGNKNYWAKE